jgi:outer membrane protein assembly factor BamB
MTPAVPRRRILCAVAAAALLAACGSGGAPPTQRAARGPAAAPDARPAGATAAPARRAGRDWTRFGYDAARTNVAPRGIPAARLAGLRERRVALPGTVDASPILLAGVRVAGARHDLLVMTTTYGRTLGLDAASGRILWRFTPASYAALAGSPQITTATPVADPGRRLVFAASPDGRVHRLRVRDGREARSRGWPAVVTRDPTHEKIASALNLDGRRVLVTTGGYIGDAPPYQGKIVAIDRRSGRLVHVFNSLCSGRRAIIAPSSCPSSDSAIWGRAGAVVDPVTRRIFATTSNGPFDGHADWGDSVLELSPGAARLLRHYTPREQAALEAGDVDLGSTSPALLPRPGGGRATAFLLQGGKDGKLRLLDATRSLSGVTGAAGRRLGGERQIVPAPGGQVVLTAPAVAHAGGRTVAYVAAAGGTAAYALRGGRLRTLWSNATAGTSPVLAGGVLWVYDPGGALNAYRARDGRLLRRLPAPAGHWNSPIVAGGRVYLPSGDANQHATTGTLSIYGAR